MRLEAIIIAAAFAAGITLAILTVRTYHRAISRGLGTLADGFIQFRFWQILGVLFGLALLWTFLDGRMYRDGYFFLLIAASLAIGFTVLWVREFLFLMALRDDDLPGRLDKPIWAAVLIALPPLGLYLFRTHRLAHWPEPEPKPRMAPAAHDLA